MKDFLVYYLIFVEILWAVQEYISAIFNYSKKNETSACIVDFKSTGGRIFECRHYSVVEINNIQYLVRRSLFDKIGRTIKVSLTNQRNRVLNMPLCYRKKYEVLYVNFFQFMWHLTVIPIIVCYFWFGR